MSSFAGRLLSRIQRESATPLGTKDQLSFAIESAIILGLIWAWVYCGYSFTAIAGMADRQILFFRVGTGLAQCASCAIAALLPPAGRVGKAHAPTGAFLALASIALLCFGPGETQDATGVFALSSGVLLGLSYGLLLVRWIARNIHWSFNSITLIGFAAAAVTALAVLVMGLIQGEESLWVGLILPLCAAGLSVRRHNAPPASFHAQTSTAQKKNVAAIFLSTVLSGGIARSLLSSVGAPTKPASWFWTMFLLSIVCVALLIYFREKATPNSILACCIGLTCVAVLCATALPLSDLTALFLLFETQWFLLVYSIMVSAYCGSLTPKHSLRVAYACLGSIFIADVLTNYARIVFSNDSALLTTVVVFLAFSLVCLLLFRDNESAEAPSTEEPKNEQSEIDERIAALAAEDNLSERETEVFALTAKGYTIKGIAEKLFISQSTVKFHQRNIYQKLGVSSKQELITKANETEEA